MVIVNCYVSVGTLNIIKHLLCIFCSSAIYAWSWHCWWKKINQQNTVSFSVTSIIREFTSLQVDWSATSQLDDKFTCWQFTRWHICKLSSNRSEVSGTVRHSCQNVLVLKCLGSEGSGCCPYSSLNSTIVQACPYCILLTGMLTGWGPPGTGWFDLRSSMEYGPKTNSSLSHILCRRFLNAFADVAHTTSSSSLFHECIIRSEKKWCRRSLLILFFFNFHLWPRVILAESISKNVWSVTDEYPWVIFKTSIRSACTRRSSSEYAG